MKPILVVGSLNADLVVRVRRFPAPGETVTGSDFAVFPGGKGANQAVAAARLGGRVSMIGLVGDDDHGRQLRASLTGAGADASRVRALPDSPTGTAVITIDAAGQNEIVVVPGANGRLRPEDVEAHGAAFHEGAIVLLQLEVAMETVEATARLARARGCTVILDPAPARAEAVAMLQLVDVVTPNETELGALADEPGAETSRESALRLARALLARGPSLVICKLGALGAIAVSAEGDRFWRAHPVTPVDTTAAGDVWNGAFAVGLAEGRTVDEAAAFAGAAAAVSVTRAGAQPSMPTRAEVEQRFPDARLPPQAHGPATMGATRRTKRTKGGS